MSVEQVANYIGISKETIYRLLRDKKIPSHRIGKLHKFKASEIDEWISGKRN